ncbi:MAG TPA: protein kinase, partial [Polyangiaceae bacterium]|nr:protein kinase [Polyangiaceae bacterium]
LSAVGLLEASDAQDILVVEEAPGSAADLLPLFAPLGQRLHTAAGATQACSLAPKLEPALIVIDVSGSALGGLELCRRLKQTDTLEHVPIIVCLTWDVPEQRVEALRAGAADVITRRQPPEEVHVRLKAQLALARLVTDLKAKNRELSRELALAQAARQQELSRLQGPLLGDSPPVRSLRSNITAQAKSDAPLLLLSEPSCGDEAVARAVHDASRRSDQPFFKIQCTEFQAENAPELLPSLDNPEAPLSLLEMAQGGTVYLDHIGQLPAALQRQLAAWLTFTGRGRSEGKTPAIDCRVIASITDSSGDFPVGFDPELADHLRKHTIRLPSLIERPEDLPALTLHFVRRHSAPLGRVITHISNQSLEDLRNYSWPGNLRELEDVVRRSVIASRGAELHVDHRLLESDPTVGSYRLTRQLGVGGMGEVWEARHQLLARPAAIKLITSGDADPNGRDTLIRRFQREARVTAALTSPNTVKLYDFGVGDDGSFYYVMELLAGIDLEDAVERFGPMPATRVANIMLQACHSLAEAHGAGLVHRDIKPSNLYLCKQGLEVDFVKVLDFGMVTPQPDSRETRLTQQNRVYGTLAYVSPEAALGQRELTGKADIYALGCVAYWLLVGELVFQAKTPLGILKQHLKEDPPSLSAQVPDLPLELETLVLACLAKNPVDRPSALDVWSTLVDTGLPGAWSAEDAFVWWQQHLPHVVNAPTLGSLPPEEFEPPSAQLEG